MTYKLFSTPKMELLPTTSECLLVIFVCLLGGHYVWRKLKPNAKLPPGPWALPLLGNALQIGRKPHLTFLKWSKKYGPIFKLKIGNMKVVVIHDHKMVKELFIDGATTGRMTDNPIVHAFTKGPNGIINAHGPTWQEQRRFALQTLCNFGFAKTSMEDLILDEARAVVNWFKERVGEPLTGNHTVFNAPVVNSLWRIVSGERCEWEKIEPPVVKAAREFFLAMNQVTTNGLMFAPVLRFIAPGFFGWYRYLNSVDNMFSVVGESVKQHKETFDSNNLRDYIDHHLKEIESTTDPESSFYKEKGEINLAAGIFDLFVAGSETTASTLSWSLLYLSHHPEIQRKLQAEIDLVLGSELPSVSNRQKMPYSEAVVLETFRISSVVSLGIPHCVQQDITFHGYHLPKGTSIFSNIYGIHHDPDVWGDDVEAFRPERFLNEDETNVVQNEAWMPFAAGKRRCLGENLAKDTLFLFLVSIFQQFHVRPSDKDAFPDYEPELGFVLVPKPFNIVMSLRGQ